VPGHRPPTAHQPPWHQRCCRYDSYNGDTSAAQRASPDFYETARGYLKFGWTAYPCTAKVYSICQFNSADLLCSPPPNPPSPPLSPPSPPSPPAPPNCAPKYNATFFCDGQALYCYSFHRTAAPFAAASAACQAMSGWLVKYESASQQYDVEQVSKG
jgi:hypothetical protein